MFTGAAIEACLSLSLLDLMFRDDHVVITLPLLLQSLNSCPEIFLILVENTRSLTLSLRVADTN